MSQDCILGGVYTRKLWHSMASSPKMQENLDGIQNPKRKQTRSIISSSITILVGGFNSSEKYESISHIGSFSQVGWGENKKCLKPPANKMC